MTLYYKTFLYLISDEPVKILMILKNHKNIFDQSE